VTVDYKAMFEIWLYAKDSYWMYHWFSLFENTHELVNIPKSFE
jgi:hypothetical protein